MKKWHNSDIDLVIKKIQKLKTILRERFQGAFWKDMIRKRAI